MEIKLGLHLGDCLEGMRSLPSESVHLIATDPPYGIGYVTNHRGDTVRRGVNGNILETYVSSENTEDVARVVENDAKFDPDFMGPIFRECNRILAPNTHAYFFCADDTLPEFVTLLRESFTVKNVLVWQKGNWTAGDLEGQYGKECEFIVFCHKGRRKLIGGRPSSHIFVPRIDPGSSIHSCQKPTTLMSFLIEHSTVPNEIVCDPFSGSGTTAVAALGLGREFVGWELDPKTYAIAKGRLEADAVQAKLF